MLAAREYVPGFTIDGTKILPLRKIFGKETSLEPDTTGARILHREGLRAQWNLLAAAWVKLCQELTERGLKPESVRTVMSFKAHLEQLAREAQIG